MSMPSAINKITALNRGNQQSHTRIDSDLRAAFFNMSPNPRPCFTPTLLQELDQFQKMVASRVERSISQNNEPDICFTVLSSAIPNTYNLGGDLNLFLELIRKKDREALLDYAITCVKIAHKMSTGLDLPLTTIALVQGSAQGGGFEAALSCNVIIAEQGSMMGFPEVLFNLFPGMGAYTFLRQRVNTSLAERIIRSGKQYQAEELFQIGIVDILAKPGEGEQALKEYIRHSDRHTKVNDLLRFTRNEFNKVEYEELRKITELWVDSALDLGDREFKTMERLIRFQNRKIEELEKQQEQGKSIA